MVRDATTHIITQKVILRECCNTHIKQPASPTPIQFFTETLTSKQKKKKSNTLPLESDITFCQNVTSFPVKTVTSPQFSLEKMTSFPFSSLTSAFQHRALKSKHIQIIMLRFVPRQGDRAREQKGIVIKKKKNQITNVEVDIILQKGRHWWWWWWWW